MGLCPASATATEGHRTNWTSWGNTVDETEVEDYPEEWIAEELSQPNPEQWALLNEMRPHFCCLKLDSDYGYVWDIRGSRDGHHAENIWLSGPASHRSLGRAIEVAHTTWKNLDSQIQS